MKWFWFFAMIALTIKGVALTYAAATGMIEGTQAQHTFASFVATAFIAYGAYLHRPWAKQ